ncbi:LytTR family transcriptional regulator [Spirosoma sp. BT702]|uniref:LytTR family transcriptional regulator n=1 Tax=Spirosoma profusum TaxID=2771354 RepID=A0A927GB29_9BACT|nr:LytTR family DNA-binding domain-containing protein [Spirosoma profusum]MBD2705640.1 LytTR family transcriptional regulator [Spirosoma profusum]
METIELRGTKSRRRVEIRFIEYCVSDGNYTYVYLKGEQPVLMAKTLLRFAEQLPNFIRIHKGTLVNPAHIIGHRSQKGNVLVCLSGDRALLVSRRRATGFRQQLFGQTN